MFVNRQRLCAVLFTSTSILGDYREYTDNVKEESDNSESFGQLIAIFIIIIFFDSILVYGYSKVQKAYIL